MVRDATTDDGAAIAAIYNAYIRTSTATFEEEPVEAAIMASRISSTLSDGYDWLVAEDDGQLIGYAYSSRWMARPAYRFTVEVSVYVAETAHSKGVGRALYDALFERLRAKNYHTVIGIITLPNPASVHLHESYGLTKVAHYREVGRKFDQWIDVGQWQGMLSS
ncbi:MAG: N-acetyltransferase family protein [Pseudomonadota bacterium]